MTTKCNMPNAPRCGLGRWTSDERSAVIGRGLNIFPTAAPALTIKLFALYYSVP